MREPDWSDVKQLRSLLGWQGEELAERLGVTQQTISNLETGKRKVSQAYSLALKYIITHDPCVDVDEAIRKRQDEIEMLEAIKEIRKEY